MVFKKNDVKTGGESYVSKFEQAEQTSLREEAIKAVKSQHGPYVNRLKNYEALVDDAMKQMIKAGEDNKTF